VTATLSILAVDDELPSLDEISYLLDRSALAGPVLAVRSATEALRQLERQRFDLVLLDIRMPGLDGLELSRLLGRFADPPAVVFVTAHEQHALEAFDVGAVGYLLKPPNKDRLDRVLERVIHDQRSSGEREELDTLPVGTGSSTRIVNRNDIRWVEASGDYVRLHLRDGSSHLLRMSLTALEHEWADHGFARVHRSYLVAIREILELRTDASGGSVLIGQQVLPVSRRHMRELRDRLVRHVRTGGR
jgi:DNA-binding LytR/AlgR family response regulator